MKINMNKGIKTLTIAVSMSVALAGVSAVQATEKRSYILTTASTAPRCNMSLQPTICLQFFLAALDRKAVFDVRDT